MRQKLLQRGVVGKQRDLPRALLLNLAHCSKSARHTVNHFRSLLQSKLGDIDKVRLALSSKGISFRPPLPPIVPLLRMGRFISKWGCTIAPPYINHATQHTIWPTLDFQLLAQCCELVAASVHPDASADASLATWLAQDSAKAKSTITACERVVEQCALVSFVALQLAGALQQSCVARDSRSGAHHRAATRSMRSAADALLRGAGACLEALFHVLQHSNAHPFGSLGASTRLVPWLRACMLSLPLPQVDDSSNQAEEERALRDAASVQVITQLQSLLTLVPAPARAAASLSVAFATPLLTRRVQQPLCAEQCRSGLLTAVSAVPLAELDTSSRHLGALSLPQRGVAYLDSAVSSAAEAGFQCALHPKQAPTMRTGKATLASAASPAGAAAGAGSGHAPSASGGSGGWLARWWSGHDALQPEAIDTRHTTSGAGASAADAQSSHHPSAPEQLVDVWPWWLWALGNFTDSISQRGAHSLAKSPEGRRELELFLVFAARCVPMLPGDFWVSGSPAVWRRVGARQVATSMPLLLVRQLRLLSEPSFITPLARVCVRPGAIVVPRLLLPDGDEGDTAAPHSAGGGGAAAGQSSQSWWGKLFGSKKARAQRPSAAAAPESGNFAEWLQSSRLAKWLGAKKSQPGGGAAAGEEASGEERESLLEDAGDLGESGPLQGNAGGGDAPLPRWPGPLALRFAALYGALLARASGMGKTGVYSSAVFSESSLISARRVLNTLAFDARLPLVKCLWQAAVQAAAEAHGGNEDALQDEVLPAKAYAACCTLVDASRAGSDSGSMVFLSLLAPLFRHLMIVLDDLELYQSNKPLPLRELRYLVRTFKFWLARAYGYEVGIFSSKDAQRLSQSAPSVFWLGVERSIVGSLAALYDRHTRRPLGGADMFTLPMEAGASAWGAQSNVSIALRLVQLLPCAVPFEQRLKWFHDTRLAHYTEHRALPALALPVRREAIFDMAFARVSAMDTSQLHRKFHVQFTNEHGLSEAGIDAGGLFKELWTELAGVIFNPGYGLFRVTPTRQLYPNPQAAVAVGVSDDTPLFRFVGRVLGKAVYEGVVVQPQFAPFTLAKLLGKPVNLHYLPSLDADLYKNLMFLKTYEGDAADLCLTFTLPGDDGDMSHRGATHAELPLVPGGGDKDVTNGNKIQYIHLVADAKLNKAMAKQTAALVAGFHDVIPPSWLSSFSEPELQTLLSGAAGDIDIDDLAAHTRYAGGYFSSSSTIKALWKVLRELPEEDKAAFLRFVTACERPPPLGFKDLDPPFTIQRVGDTSRLPSASTCFNILKLGDFGSASVVREKLLYAIRSGAGFELS